MLNHPPKGALGRNKPFNYKNKDTARLYFGTPLYLEKDREEKIRIDSKSVNLMDWNDSRLGGGSE